MYNSTITNTFPYGYGNYNIGGSTIPQQGGRQVMMVGGYNGASMIQMGPNESVLALDESGTMVWLVKTDGAGYKNVIQAYDITPHQQTPSPDFSVYEERIKKLEDQASRLDKIEREIGEMRYATTTTNSASIIDVAPTSTNAKSVTILGQN